MKSKCTFFWLCFIYKIECSKTMTKFAFRRYKRSKLSRFHQYGSMILMTSLCTSASHQIFCPIKCSLESKASHPLHYRDNIAQSRPYSRVGVDHRTYRTQLNLKRNGGDLEEKRIEIRRKLRL